MSFLLNEGGETDKASICVNTRKNRFIRNVRRQEWTKEALAEDLRKCRAQYPEIIIRSVTAVYNCVGMVFGVRRTWIDPDQIPMILEDDGYRHLPGLWDLARIGDVVIY